MFIIIIFQLFTYYPSMYRDKVIIDTIIIVLLLATTVTVVCVYVTTHLLHH